MLDVSRILVQFLVHVEALKATCRRREEVGGSDVSMVSACYRICQCCINGIRSKNICNPTDGSHIVPILSMYPL